ADGAYFRLGDFPAPADQRNEPARIRIVLTTDIEAEPDARRAVRAARSRARRGLLAVLPRRPLRTGVEKLLGRRQPGAVEADQGGGDLFSRTLRQQDPAGSQILL